MVGIPICAHDTELGSANLQIAAEHMVLHDAKRRYAQINLRGWKLAPPVTNISTSGIPHRYPTTYGCRREQTMP
ncbi:hypothetical protein FZEAL_1776 [Fusarium zealandicum]|uniref:Uncharacterized protein n=1 Tax=Fusarium zealandicum TaxID=1053134 RepID=A0A8H4USV8_9HYPO|nr:hypothetical protein FZEAL_1776 [Fusarium zealandicum]